MRNERTGKRAATIAGRVLRRLADYKAAGHVFANDLGQERPPVCLGTVAEFRALAASALTQSADKKQRG